MSGTHIEMRGISKSFGAVTALRDVSLDLPAGSVMGLVGDNAAGKSTLMKVLAGAIQPDRGDILIDGEKVSFASPIAAREADLEVVVSLKSDLSTPLASVKGRSKKTDDFTAVLQVSGLEKGTSYHYGLGLNGAKPKTSGRFRTIQPPGSGLSLRLAFGGGMRQLTTMTSPTQDAKRSAPAVARNRDIVPRSEYAAEEIRGGDHVEILEAVGGG